MDINVYYRQLYSVKEILYLAMYWRKTKIPTNKNKISVSM